MRFPQNALPAGRKKSDILPLYFGGNVIPAGKRVPILFLNLLLKSAMAFHMRRMG
jgi:hypothetical protein